MSRSPYFVGARTDAFFAGGFSILLFIVFFVFDHAAPNLLSLALLQSLAMISLWLFNWPHFAATNARLYQSKGNMLQYPLTAFTVPLVLIAVAGAAMTSMEWIAPYFIKLFLIWSPYHYSGQNLGISWLYARRAGWNVDSKERWAQWGFVYGTFFTQTAFLESAASPHVYYSIPYPTVGLPTIVPAVFGSLTGLCAAAFVFFAARNAITRKKMPPAIYFVPCVAQFCWFILGRKAPGYYFFIPLFHSIQYLFIAWLMQLKEKMAERGLAGSKPFVWRESFAWGTLVLAGGALLFWGLPRAGAAFGAPLPHFEPIVIATLNIHHFFVDGVIWKLRNPKVASPLSTDLAELTGAAPSP